MGFLTRPKRSPKNHPVCAFDVETIGDKRRFVCGTFISSTRCVSTTDPRQLMEAILSPENRGAIVYATNLFYDYTALFKGFPAPTRAIFSGSRLIRVWYPLPGGGKVMFYDTSNLTNRMPVSALGRMCGLVKLETPPELLGKRDGHASWCCLRHKREYCVECYNRRDTEITFEWAKRFQSACAELGCEVKTTIASTALDLYKRRFAPDRLFMPPSWLNRTFRQAYHGGLVFVFRKGLGESVTYYDINSLYPFVLATRDYPDITSMVYHPEGGGIDDILRYEGFSRCVVDYPSCYFPILPVVINGYFTTCTGRYEGFWTHVELREAVSRGAEIVDIHETILFKRTIRPLAGYMRELYCARQKARSEGQLFEKVYKLFMNALSGKFGQRSDNSLYEPVDVDSIINLRELQGIVTIRAGNVEYYIKEHPTMYQPDYINVAWAAYMTAYARLHEIAYLEEAFPDVYACDTDSVFTHYQFELSDELGGMGIKDTPKNCIFLYPKQYASWDSGGKWTGRVKGVPKELQEQYVREGQVSWSKPTTFKEALREHCTPGDWVVRTRTDRDKYDKRVFLRSVDPFVSNTDSRPFTCREAYEYFTHRPPCVPWRQVGTIPRTRLYRRERPSVEDSRLEAEIRALLEAIPLPHSVVFRFWDYRRDVPRRVRDKDGELTTWDKAVYDEVATEYGYPDAESFVSALRESVKIRRRIGQLKRKLHST